MKKIMFIVLGLFLASCSSQPILPEKDSVEVSRKAPDSDCKKIGKIVGRVMSTKGTSQQALEDLKKEAAHKGANYVVIQQYSDTGTSVTGIAYQCP